MRRGVVRWTGEMNFGDLGGRVPGEDLLVVGALEEVFIGGSRGGFAEVLFDDWAGGNFRAGGCGTAFGGHGEDGEGAVIEPGDGVGEDGVGADAGELGGVGAGDVDDPEAEASGILVDGGEVAAVGRPLGVEDVEFGGK